MFRKILIAIALCGCLLSGCAQVAPWQRGHLAKPQMALDAQAMQRTTRAHRYESREAASGGGMGSGGGCGCY